MQLWGALVYMCKVREVVSMRLPVQGGESVALARLADQLSDKGWVAAFEKPKGDPSAFIKPATTVLSPHLKFGTLSCRLFHARLQQVAPGDAPGAPVAVQAT